MELEYYSWVPLAQIDWMSPHFLSLSLELGFEVDLELSELEYCQHLDLLRCCLVDCLLK